MKRSAAAAVVLFVFAGVSMAMDLNVPKIDQAKLEKATATAQEKGQEAKQKSEELNVQKVQAAQTVAKAGAATETGGQVLEQKSTEVGAQKGSNSKVTAVVTSKTAKAGKAMQSKGKIVKEKAGTVK